MNTKTGFLLIDKPSGLTSHDIIDRLRKITGIKKIGHAGTLDPFATGLLIVGIGREATRELSKFLKQDKEYIANIKLGAKSSTFDPEGLITSRKNPKIPKLEDIQSVLKNFIGEIEQMPPIFSAKKIGGKKSYELARKGEVPKLKPVKIKIYSIEIQNYKWPFLEIVVSCSSGTYIRSLANDIGENIDIGGYLEELRRTKIGEHSVEKAKKLEEITKKNWQSFLF